MCDSDWFIFSLTTVKFNYFLYNWPKVILVSYFQVPDLCEDLLSSVDQPLKVARDKATGKDYLLCDYNRDGDSYRYIICHKLMLPV